MVFRAGSARSILKFSALDAAPTNAAKGTGSRFELANGRTVRQGGSDIDALRDAQGIFEFNAKIPNSTVNLGVTKQQLDCSEGAGLTIDLRRLCPAERVGAVSDGSRPIAVTPSRTSRPCWRVEMCGPVMEPTEGT